LVYVHQLGVLMSHLGGPEGLGPAQSGPVVPRRADLALGDVNRDGRVDAILNSPDERALVYLGDGGGGFLAAPQTWPLRFRSRPPVVADFDGDGFSDLIAGADADG